MAVERGLYLIREAGERLGGVATVAQPGDRAAASRSLREGHGLRHLGDHALSLTG